MGGGNPKVMLCRSEGNTVFAVCRCASCAIGSVALTPRSVPDMRQGERAGSVRDVVWSRRAKCKMVCDPVLYYMHERLSSFVVIADQSSSLASAGQPQCFDFFDEFRQNLKSVFGS